MTSTLCMRSLIAEYPYRIINEKSEMIWKGKDKAVAEQVFEHYRRTGEIPKEGELPKASDANGTGDAEKFPGVLMDRWSIWKISGTIN